MRHVMDDLVRLYDREVDGVDAALFLLLLTGIAVLPVMFAVLFASVWPFTLASGTQALAALSLMLLVPPKPLGPAHGQGAAAYKVYPKALHRTVTRLFAAAAGRQGLGQPGATRATLDFDEPTQGGICSRCGVCRGAGEAEAPSTAGDGYDSADSLSSEGSV